VQGFTDECGCIDVRFPTSLTGDGTDAMNTDCDYSSAYVSLLTSGGLVGHGMTFTIGRGNDIVCAAIKEVAARLVGKDAEELFANMGKTWDYLCADPQLRWYNTGSSSDGCGIDQAVQDWPRKGCNTYRPRCCEQRSLGYVCSIA
jgi:L-alanine-DL-glutamate epimerase-like enolase superfamily enzyme